MTNFTWNQDPEWIGKKFNFLTVSGFLFTKDNAVVWECICDCGRKTQGQPSVVRNGGTTQCRTCARRKSSYTTHPRIKDGNVFGYLTVIKRQENGKWLCSCKCGGSIEIEAKRFYRVKVAGCLNCEGERRALWPTTHGGSRSKLHGIWSSMKTRCEKPLSAAYKYYGAKGVKICTEWHDFRTFRSWAISNGFRDGLSIDRLNPEGNYEPSNCEWITRSENSRRVTYPKVSNNISIESYILGQLGMVA